ncbi:unnamed protein product [Candidula unifasciata]|uniref:Uncharacterized protein n=1 Tax=Candidula unifasciata TaxID=100452 RepID=A0A8S3YPY4_9EUPU|nr:unnamed protein product [Candidula unifasciata]
MPRRGQGRGRARGRGGRGTSTRRGRGRGSRNRGKGGWSTGRTNRGNRDKTGTADATDSVKELSIVDNPKAYFTGTSSTEQHLQAQNENRIRYAATLAVLVKNRIEVTQNACIRALSMAWARGDHELASAFLHLPSQFGLVEVLKALTMLDSGRKIRVLEKRLARLQLSGSKVKPNKIGKLKLDINNLNKLKPPIGSASGAVCKHVARWVRDFSAEELEFFAIHFPKDPWQKLADICHLNPQKDFPAAPWFLPYCFGSGPPPIGSLVEHCQNITEENVNDLVKEYDIPYSVLKQFKSQLNVESKGRIARYEPKLDTVLWWYEDLACDAAEEAIAERLAAGERVNLPNGKLLERLLTISLRRNISFKPGETTFLQDGCEISDNFLTRLIDVAEPHLKSIRLNLESPIVVIGDASGSMDVAIRTSTIIASLLTAICSAQLVFFNSENRDAPFLPKTVNEMLKLALSTKAEGGTAPAASLYPFYKNKEVVKTFIIVTDEEENEQKEGYNFAELFKKYHDEVYPANLVFVSFLRGQHAEGIMVTQLNELGFHPKQLRLEGSRPDLTKLDDLFAQLSAATTSSFQEDLQEAEQFVKENGVAKLYQPLKKANTVNGEKQAKQ